MVTPIRARFIAALLVQAAICTGCVGPSNRADERAAELGFNRKIIAGGPFRHLLYFKPGPPDRARLHVYIEHDGLPWAERTSIAADPTPHRALMLEWMGLDSAPALYLGRPCYFGVEPSPPCSPLAWTHRRYSEEVVASMAAALRAFLAEHPYKELAIFGYSGGGALAVLLAERVPETVAVVTVAANLDIDRWAKLHAYSALEGSLNPAARPPLPARIAQRHYAGGRDRNVPADIVRAYTASRGGAAVVEIPEFDHTCCWIEIWPRILADLRARSFSRFEDWPAR